MEKITIEGDKPEDEIIILYMNNQREIIGGEVIQCQENEQQL